jgi:hypothetical protein
MAKKRPTLDAFLTSQTDTEKINQRDSSSSSELAESTQVAKEVPVSALADKNASQASQRAGKPEIVRHMLYLPLPVYNQLQELVFEEQRGQAKRRKTHDYLLDAINLLFREKGLKSISDLMEKR